jgi:hypothetical protein
MGACATKIIEETDTEMILDTRGGVWIKFDKVTLSPKEKQTAT